MTYIILDRDGVINYDSEHYIKSPDEWIPIPGSLEAIARLNRAGFKIVIATNQSGIARGYYDVETLDRIHEKLARELAAVGGYIDEFFFCPHHPDEGCGCRKPKPGMLEKIKHKYKLDMTQTYFIGDSYVDVKAAQTIGCLPLLVKTGNGAQAINKHPELAQVSTFNDLVHAVEFVLSQSGHHHG